MVQRAEQMAGTRNLNTMSAIIETWQDAKSLANDALTDTDFIDETQMKYMDSMEAKLNELKATGQDFWNTLLDSGMINTGIGLITQIVSVTQQLVTVFGSLGNVLPIVNSGFTTLIGTLGTAYAAYKVFTNVKGTGGLLSGLQKTGTQLNDFFTAFSAKGKDIINAFKYGFSQGTGLFGSLAEGASKASIVIGEVGTAILGIGAAAAAIGIAVKVFDELTTSSKEAAENAKKAADNYQSGQEKISNAKSLLDSSGREFAELSKGVDNNGNNISLTTEEFTKYHDICSQIAETFPTLITGYDEQGDAIVKLKDGVKDLNDEYDKLRLTEANENIQNLPTYQEDFNNKNGDRSIWTWLKDQFTDLGYADRGGRTTDKEVLDLLDKLQSAKSIDKFNTLIQRYSRTDELSNIKKEVDISAVDTKEELKKKQEELQSYTATITSELEASGDNIKTAMQSWLTKMTLDSDMYPEYKNIDSSITSMVSSLINSLNSDDLQKLDEKGISVQQYVKKLLDGLNGSETVQEALQRIMKIDDTSSIDDIKQALGEDLQTVKDALGYDGESLDDLKVRLKLDGKEDFLKEVDSLTDLVSEKFGGDLIGTTDATKKEFEETAKTGAEAAKLQFEKSLDELQSYKEELETAYNSYVNGNIDYAKRPVISAKEMWAKGWGLPDSKVPIKEGQTVTTYSGGYTGTDSKLKQKLYLEMTPILDNGEVLTPKELKKYVDGLFEKGNVLESDKIENGGKGLVLSMFDEWDDQGLDDWQNKLAAVKDEHSQAMQILKEAQEYVNQNDSEGLQKYLDETYDNLDSKELKDIVKTIKQEVKESKELSKNTKRTGKENKDRAATEKRVEGFLKENNVQTVEQVRNLEDCVRTTDSWADAMQKFNLNNVNDQFDDVIKNLEQNLNTVEQDIEHINEAIQASHTSMGLTKDEIDNVVKAFSGLDGYNYDQLFESTAEGVHLNVQEVDRLNGEYRKMQQGKYDEAISDATKEYEKLCVQINETSGAERNNYINEKNRLSDQIQSLRELQSRYEGLTNAVTRYQQAKANGEEGQTYDLIAGDVDDIKELYDHGLVGTNQFKAAVQMMTNEDLSGQGTGKYLEVYKKKAEGFFSYFTENGEGVEKFLKKLETGGFAKQGKDGTWSIEANLTELSEKYDLDKSVITELFKKLNDFGFDIDFEEEKDNLRSLREEAEKAKESLNGTYQLNFETDDINELDKEIQKGKEYRTGLEKTKDFLKNQIDTLKKSKKAIEQHGDTSSDAYKNICKNLEETEANYKNTTAQLENLNKELDYTEAKKGEKVDLDVDINSSAGIEKLKKELETLNKIDKVKLEIDWDSEDPDYWAKKSREMADVIKNLPDGKIDINTEEGKAAYDVIQGIAKEQLQISRPTILDMDVSQFSAKQQVAMGKIADLMQKSENLKYLQLQANMGIDVPQETIDKAKGEVETAAKNISDTNPNVAIALGIADKNMDGGATLKNDVSEIVSDLNNSDISKAYIKLGVNKDAVKEYMDEDTDKKATTKYDLDKTEKLKAYETANVDKEAKTTYHLKRTDPLKAYENKNLNRDAYVTYHKKTVDDNAHNGNAHAQGTTRPSLISRGKAFARGTWGAAKTGMSLVGELGQELVKYCQYKIYLIARNP